MMQWLIIGALLLAGCAPTNLAQILEAAGKDPASVCGSITSVYGTLKFARTNITNGDVACTQEGLTVRSTPPTIPVGVRVVPAK